MGAGSIDRVIERVDAYVRQRMDEEGIPSLVIALTDREGLLFSRAYGYADVPARIPATTSTLYETGSIGKSFTAVALLQLQEAGLVDLQAPVTDYLPWFTVQSGYEPIRLHHLLSHTSGLIGGTDYTPSQRMEVWSLRETETGSPPGTYFHYSDVGYKILGLILEKLAGQPYARVIRERILDPLGMHESDAAITHDTRRKMAQPYARHYDDRPWHPDHPLIPAPWLETDTGDGCIVSSVHDLAIWTRALMNGGAGLISSDSFAQLTQKVILAGADDPSEFYGYGVVTTDLNGNALVGHSGGMVGYYSFMCADMDAGVGACAIVNGIASDAPRQTARYALELLQAVAQNRELQPVPAPIDRTQVEQSADFAGTYRATNGSALTLVAEDSRLLLDLGDTRIALEHRSEDAFRIPHPDFERHLLRFGRDDAGTVVEAFHGPDWYSSDAYSGTTTFDYPEEWNAYPGHYRCYNPWETNVRIVLRKGRLALLFASGAEEPLTPLPEGSFRVGSDLESPERAVFHDEAIVDGQCLRVTLSGNAFDRFFTP